MGCLRIGGPVHWGACAWGCCCLLMAYVVLDVPFHRDAIDVQAEVLERCIVSPSV